MDIWLHTEVSFLYSPAAALMLPEFQDIQCSQWVLGLAAKAVTGDASREPESEKAPPSSQLRGEGEQKERNKERGNRMWIPGARELSLQK